MERNSLNKIAVNITRLVLLLAILVTFLVVYIPERWIAAIDSVQVKYILLLAIYTFISWIAIQIYRIYYIPAPRRLILVAFRWILLIGVISIGSPVGLAAIDEFSFSNENSIKITMKMATDMSVYIFLIMVVALVFLTKEYTAISKYEKENGMLN